MKYKWRKALILTVAFFASVVFCFPIFSRAYISATDSPANVVVGQPNMTSKDRNQDSTDPYFPPAANTLYWPTSAFSDGTRLFVSDYFNNRVLIYNTIPTSNDAPADVVIGQPNMTSYSANQAAPSGAANTLYQPYEVYSDGTKLFICDYLNSRVLIYNSIPTTNDASADVVIGQASMDTNSRDRGVAQPTAAANGLDWPMGIHVSDNKLFIADTGNHRALIYDPIPTSQAESDAGADIVIGQPNMTSYNQNHGLGGETADAQSLSQPSDMFVSGSKLFISDYGNSRVLIFNTIPTSSNPSADVVVGQVDMAGAEQNQGGSIAANTLRIPDSVYSDGTRLFVTDAANNRTLIYNSIPTSNNASADVVIGQADMASGLENRVGTSTPPTANTQYAPSGLSVAANKLFIADSGNNRITIYNLSPGITMSDTPGVGPISINSGAASTPTHAVTLTLKADGAKDMMISNDPNFVGASWESYQTTKLWELAPHNSIKTVYVRFRDYANYESSVYSDYIDLPSALPTTGRETTQWPTLLAAPSAFILLLGLYLFGRKKI